MSKKMPGIGPLASFLLFQKCDRNYAKVYVELWKQFGHACSVHLPMKRYLFTHPDHVKHILKDNAANYHKSSDYDSIKMALGEGLLNAEGETWRRNRLLLAPEFQHSYNVAKIPIVVKEMKLMCDLWEACADYHQARDVHSDMLEVGFQIVGDAFFGEDLGNMSNEAGKALANLVDKACERIVSIVKFPPWVPTPLHRSYYQSVRKLDEVIERLYKSRMARKVEGKDFVSRLLEAVSTIPSEKVRNKIIRDELFTILLAAHETSAATMSWTLWFLSQHPDVERKLWAELDEVLGGRIPDATDLPKLVYTKMILQESMRMRPGIPVVTRVALAADEIGGYPIRKGSVVTCAQVVTHQDPEFWREPEKFMPERFEKNLFQKQYPYSYFPFGAGPRFCIGDNLAVMQMTIMLAIMAQRFHFRLDESHKVISHAAITLRPKYGVKLFFERRTQAARALPLVASSSLST